MPLNSEVLGLNLARLLAILTGYMIFLSPSREVPQLPFKRQFFPLIHSTLPYINKDPFILFHAK
jgi:hypothetical protein